MDVRDFINDVASNGPHTKAIKQRAGNRITNDIVEKYQDILEQFYGGYDPKWYDRTFVLRYGKHYWKPSGRKGDLYGIIISGEYGEQYLYNADYNITVDRVMDLMWDGKGGGSDMEGVRGLPAYGEETGWTNPYFMTFSVTLGNATGSPHAVIDSYVTSMADKYKSWQSEELIREFLLNK